MKRLSKALFGSVKSNPALFVIVCASFAAHAIFITAAFLTPREPPPPRHPFADCAAPSPAQEDIAEGGGASIATGGAEGWGAPGTGAAGAAGSLEAKAVTSLERRYLPCCGPGCITPMEPGEE